MASMLSLASNLQYSLCSAPRNHVQQRATTCASTHLKPPAAVLCGQGRSATWSHLEEAFAQDFLYALLEFRPEVTFAAASTLQHQPHSLETHVYHTCQLPFCLQKSGLPVGSGSHDHSRTYTKILPDCACACRNTNHLGLRTVSGSSRGSDAVFSLSEAARRGISMQLKACMDSATEQRACSRAWCLCCREMR